MRRNPLKNLYKPEIKKQVIQNELIREPYPLCGKTLIRRAELTEEEKALRRDKRYLKDVAERLGANIMRLDKKP